MLPLNVRAAIVTGLALLVASPSFARYKPSKRPHRVAHRHAAQLKQISDTLPRYQYGQPIRESKVGSTQIAQGRYGTAAVFKDGSWGFIGGGGITISTPVRSGLTPKGPRAILEGIERSRPAARDRTQKPSYGPPKGVTRRRFSSYRLTLQGTERTNLDGSTVSSSDVVNCIPNTPHKGKRFSTLSRNHPWVLESHTSTATVWRAKQKTTQRRDAQGRFLPSGQDNGSVPLKKQSRR
jgi:hypothetical protein